MFKSSVRSAGDSAGVFEYDDDTAYFYLFKTLENAGLKIVSVIQISRGIAQYTEADICILWDTDDCEPQESYGNLYKPGQRSGVPPIIAERFEPSNNSRTKFN